MRLNGILFALFGLILLIGGAMGYLKAHSFASLMAGSIMGLSMCFFGFMTLKQQILFENVGLVFALCIDLFFAYRMLNSHAFFPSGMMTILSSIVVIIACISIKKRLSKTIN